MSTAHFRQHFQRKLLPILRIDREFSERRRNSFLFSRPSWRRAQKPCFAAGAPPDSHTPIHNPGTQSVLRFKCGPQFREFFAIVNTSCAVNASNVIKRFLGCKSVLNKAKAAPPLAFIFQHVEATQGSQHTHPQICTYCSCDIRRPHLE